MRRRRSAVAAPVLLAAVLTAGCARGAGGGPPHLALPRGATVIAGPREGTGPAEVGSDHLGAGESVGVEITCRGAGRVWLRGSGLSSHDDLLDKVQVFCHGDEGGGGGATWVQPTAHLGTVRVVARARTRWRVAVYRMPVPLDVPTPSASTVS